MIVRNRRELEGMAGMFVNMLALRTRSNPQMSFRQLLERVRQVSTGALAHQETPFDMLVEALNPARSPSRTPLFQVVFR